MDLEIQRHGSIESLYWTELPDPLNPSLLNEGWEVLTQDERKRAERFSHQPSREMYTMARLFSKTLISEQLSIPIDRIEFSYTESGKPYLADHPNYHFNISHSGNTAAFFSSPQGPVGVDVEEVRSRDCLNLARSFFSNAEINWLESSETDSEIDERFFTIWTQKEAYLKATGEGLPGGLTHYTVPCVSRADSINGFQVTNFSPRKGFMGAVALLLPS